jgi:peptidoglycan/xylan/chitin deacetylase (PgdA/CDA1 family)
METNRFIWPNGARAAVSISFDDSRPSQVDAGIPILDRHGVKATFYVLPSTWPQRLPQWKQAVRHGHELGNHTVAHPCSGNFTWAKENALENWTLRRMEQDFHQANSAIKKAFGVSPATFAYPCGNKFVGRGVATKSYVPLVARHFIAGRGFFDETANDPTSCASAQLFGVDLDGATMVKVKRLINKATEFGGWLIWVAHDVGDFPRQAVSERTLDGLCRYVENPANNVWIDTVENVARYVREQRKATGIGF